MLYQLIIALSAAKGVLHTDVDICLRIDPFCVSEEPTRSVDTIGVGQKSLRQFRLRHIIASSDLMHIISVRKIASEEFLASGQWWYLLPNSEAAVH